MKKDIENLIKLYEDRNNESIKLATKYDPVAKVILDTIIDMRNEFINNLKILLK